MWLQLLTAYSMEINGTAHNYIPGDWIEVGKQEGLRLIHSRVAVTRNYAKVIREHLGDSGIVISNADFLEEATLTVQPLGLSVVVSEEPILPFDRTVLWSKNKPILKELFAVGIGLLTQWEVACPLYSYEQLAVHVGSVEERARTQSIISDLRVPLYDTRLIFVRKGENGQRLLKEWKRQTQEGDDAQLAFLRALYLVKPLILALPISWMDSQYDAQVRD